MSFIDELNDKVNNYNDPNKSKLLNDFILDRIHYYVRDLKQLCTEQAEKGSRELKGFFVPTRLDYNYETSTESTRIINKPKTLINIKPSIDYRAGAVTGGASELLFANITLHDNNSKFDSQLKDYPFTDSMIEKVRVGILSELAVEGFKRLQIEHINGPKYGKKKGLLTENVIVVGSCNYFYVDIAW